MRNHLLLLAVTLMAGAAKADIDGMAVLKNALGMGKAPSPSSDAYCYGFNAGPYDTSRFTDVAKFMENGQKTVMGPAQTTMQHYAKALTATENIMKDAASTNKIVEASKSWETNMNGPELTKAFFSMSTGSWGSLALLTLNGLNVPEERACHAFMIGIEDHPVLNAKSGSTEEEKNAVLRNPEFIKKLEALFLSDLACVKKDADVIIGDFKSGTAFTTPDMSPRDRAINLFEFTYDSGKLMRDIRMLICSGVRVGEMIEKAANGGGNSNATLKRLVERLINDLAV